MKSSLISLLLVLTICGTASPSDRVLFLNAFGETAVAYLNDSFLLLGTMADCVVADIIEKERAQQIVVNVQKRVRVIRAKLKAVSQSRIADVDKQLIKLLDKAYACMDHQCWALTQYVEERSPQTGKLFHDKRNDCLQRVEEIAQFYSALPPPPELPEPLSTR